MSSNDKKEEEKESEYPVFNFPEQFNMADFFLDQRIKEGMGNNIAIHYKDKTITYKGNTHSLSFGRHLF